MLEQAAGLALLAALSPTALLIAAVYLGSARPRLMGLCYLAGAAAVSTLTAIVVLVVVRGAGLNRPAEHTPRYGLRLGLGVVLLVAAVVLALRKPKPPDPDKPQRGFVSRMVANPAPVGAFAVGVVVFAPGITFLAALQVIATARAGLGLTVVAVAVVVIIGVLFVWLPIALYLIAPAVTARRLSAFNDWLRAHGRTVLVCVCAVVGTIMVANGIYGLIRG